GLAVHDSRRQAFDLIEILGVYRPFAVDRRTERIHYTPDHRVANWNGHDARRAPHLIPFADMRVVAEQHSAHLVFFQVHGDARDIMRELDQLARHDFLHAMNTLS